jgi:hypothetical protein
MTDIFKKIIIAGMIFACPVLLYNGDAAAQSDDDGKIEEKSGESDKKAGDIKGEPDKDEDTRKITDNAGKKTKKAAVKKKKEKKSASKKAKEVKAADTKSEEPAPVTPAAGGNDGLLDMEDGDFRYRRIPERKIAPVIEAKMEEGKQQEKPRDLSADSDIQSNRGFLGFSSETTNYIAKGVLVFIIVVIFILYKVRARSSHRSVYKRFP